MVQFLIVPDSQTARAHAAEIILSGGVVAFRTDTFYGLGADPFNLAALEAVKKFKGREAGKPILVIISDPLEIERFVVERSEIFDAVCAQHWPGPLTIVLRARTEVPDELTAGTGTIGVRLPDDEAVRAFVRICGGALTATSANLSGDSPARTAQEVSLSFPHDLDLIIDGGTARGERPSTVLDLSDQQPRLIRQGAVGREALEKTLAPFGVHPDSLSGEA